MPPAGSDADAYFQPRRPYLTKLVREHFVPDRRAQVLDLGCGSGSLVYFARQAGYSNVTGVDHSEEQVEFARRLGVPGITQGGILEALERAQQVSIDVLVMLDVLEHLSRTDVVRVAERVGAILRPGGRWVIHVPNGASPFFGRIRYGDLTHESAFTAGSLRQLLLSSNFRVVRCYEDAPVIHGVRSLIRNVGWRLVRAGLQAAIAIETGAPDPDGVLTQNLLAVAEV